VQPNPPPPEIQAGPDPAAPEAADPQAPAPARARGGISFLARLALTVALCAGASYATARHVVGGLEDELLLRPRVVVVDFSKMALTLKDLPADTVDGAMGKVNANIKRLKEAGFVVIDGQSVLDAPDDAYLPAPVPAGRAGSAAPGPAGGKG